MAKRILIVEDDEHSREGLRRALAADGYAVETAAEGVQAIRKIKATRFDVAILDLYLPASLRFGLDGWDVVRIFRAFNPLGAILLVSAEEVVQSKVAQDGITGFLLKPIQPSQLKSMLKELTCQPDLPPPPRDRVTLSQQGE